MPYDPSFLGAGLAVAVPAVDPSDDLVEVDGSVVVDYTHFSLALSRSRRLARWVAWMIDGERLDHADISRDGVDFRADPRIDASAQTLDDVYADNSLDRGHLARRSDLLWGTRAEAEQANEDSFFFTNIAPQQADFNQSGASGVWGELEDALLASTRAERQRVVVLAGPVLAPDDPPYRGIRVPRDFWKIVAYAVDSEVTARAFLLTQDLDDLRQVGLEDFAVYQVTLADLAARTGLGFDPVLVDTRVEDDAAAVGGVPRRLASAADVEW